MKYSGRWCLWLFFFFVILLYYSKSIPDLLGISTYWYGLTSNILVFQLTRCWNLRIHPCCCASSYIGIYVCPSLPRYIWCRLYTKGPTSTRMCGGPQRTWNSIAVWRHERKWNTFWAVVIFWCWKIRSKIFWYTYRYFEVIFGDKRIKKKTHLWKSYQSSSFKHNWKLSK
jgi:hypothetical protein